MRKREISRGLLPGGGIWTKITEYWSTYGGKRQGAGRPAKSSHSKRKRISTTVSPETVTFLEAQTNKYNGLSSGRVIDCWVEMYLRGVKVTDMDIK